MKMPVLPVAGFMCLSLSLPAWSEIRVVAEHLPPGDTTPAFRFKNVPPASRNDSASAAKFLLVDGQLDGNGADLSKLHDGQLPRDHDQPAANVFFGAGTPGGRIQIDLGAMTSIKQINTYSWHSDTRAAQVYQLYASGGNADTFKAEPKKGTNPESCGWKFIAKVDTRPKEGPAGGQHGVSIVDSAEILGMYRYLLFEMDRTEDQDPFGNTFYSEIDVVDPTTPPVAVAPVETEPITKTFEAGGGKYGFTIEATAAPDLMDWADRELRPVVQEWYPKLVTLLPSEGFEAPTNVTLVFRDNMGGTPAAAGGNRISMNAGWFRRNLQGEARGSVVHEMVHVVQNYGRARRTNPSATRTPGWLVEGIADYIRWFLYEPETNGAEITARNLARAKYDASYRITGNFLNWVVSKKDKDIVKSLNAAAREGKYTEELWKKSTGKTVQELGDEWRRLHEERLAEKP